jgi:hypothetical protein
MPPKIMAVYQQTPSQSISHHPVDIHLNQSLQGPPVLEARMSNA